MCVGQWNKGIVSGCKILFGLLCDMVGLWLGVGVAGLVWGVVAVPLPWAGQGGNPPSPGVPKHARLRVSGCGRGGAYGPPPQPNPTRPGGRGIDSESRGMTSHKVRRGEVRVKG